MKKRIVSLLFLVFFAIPCFFLVSGCKESSLVFVVDDSVYKTIDLKDKETIEMPEDPTKVGYTFDGWYFDKGFDIKFENNAEVIKGISGSSDLYAKFVANKYTITFHTNMGDEIAPITQDYMSQVSAPTSPEYDGYSFAGWFTDDGTFQDEYEFTTMPLNGIDLYAKWVVSDYQIFYYLNGGVNGNNPTHYTIYTNEIILDDATKEGYDFVGWYTDVNYKDKIEKINPATIKNYALYAKFTESQYKIIYHVEDGNKGNNPDTYTIHDSQIILNDASRDGYTFEGWYLEDEYLTVVDSINIQEPKDIDLYAKFKINKYTIAFHSNEGSLVAPITQEYNTHVSVPKDPVRSGFAFAGWYTDDGTFKNEYNFTTMPIYGVTLYAKWNPAAFRLIYHLNNGENGDNPEGYYIDTETIVLKDPQKRYNTFGGWYTDSEFTSRIYVIPKGNTGDIELYAKWEQNYEIVGTVFKKLTDNKIEEFEVPDYVTEIGSSAFSNFSKLKKVTLGENVTKISSSAFYGCSNLTQVHLPEGLKEIGSSSFHNCTSLKSLVLPSSLETIGSSVFKYSGIQSITIPGSVKIIEDNVFYNSKLKEIVIEEGVKIIDYGAFQDCTYLTSVIIPNTVTSIYDSAFAYCRSLKNMNLPQSITSLGIKVFEGCSKLENINLPNIEVIGMYTFSGCVSLKSIEIPSTVKVISESAFRGCQALTTVTIPSSVTTLGHEIFYYCTSLKEVIIEAQVGNIDVRVFGSCYELETITLPNTIKFINLYAFEGCDTLKEVKFMGTEEEWNLITINDTTIKSSSVTKTFLGE